jgi:hypothetical protein
MTDDMIAHGFAWCVLRNLVHTVYREARHLGPSGDPDAMVTVSGGVLLPSAERCSLKRQNLKSVDLHTATATANTIEEVLKPYEETTGLTVDDLIMVFSLPNWKSQYGGPKWVQIAETLKKLVIAFEAGDLEQAHRISKAVYALHHNGGRLVPSSRSEWEQGKRGYPEKWPELCD